MALLTGCLKGEKPKVDDRGGEPEGLADRGSQRAAAAEQRGEDREAADGEGWVEASVVYIIAAEEVTPAPASLFCVSTPVWESPSQSW